MKRRPAAYVLAAALVATPALAFFGDEEWVELDTRLPPYPKAENLIRYYVAPWATNEYYIDKASISVGTDNVVRYTLVVRSPEGAENVTHEGVRCYRGMRKVYAYGRSDATWTEAGNPAWKQIERTRSDLHARVLYDDFFCPGISIIKTPAEGIDALRRGVHPNAVKMQD